MASKPDFATLINLHQLGFGGSSLSLILPGLTLRQLRDFGIEMKPIDRHTFDAVFQSKSSEDRMKSVLATLFLLTYNRAKDSTEEEQLRTSNCVKIILQNRGENQEKVEPDATENARLIALAYYQLMAQYRDLYSSNKKLFSIDEAFYIATAFSEKNIFIEDCICGKPILIKNKNTCDNTGAPHVNLFTCPWCGSKGKKLFSFLEAKLARHESWIGHQAQFKEKDKKEAAENFGF
jgi:hypothetical protein